MNHDELVRLGARARIAELEQELAELRKLAGGAPRGRSAKSGATPDATTAAAPAVRRRRRRSAASRKAQSEKMKAVWAARRAKKDAGRKGKTAKAK